MNNDNITIPVVGHMVRQPDGSYEMVSAEYITVSATAVARFLMERFGMPGEEVRP